MNEILGRPLTPEEENDLQSGKSEEEILKTAEEEVEKKLQQTKEDLNNKSEGSNEKVIIGGPHELQHALEAMGMPDLQDQTKIIGKDKARYDKGMKLDGVLPLYTLTLIKKPAGSAKPYDLDVKMEIRYTKNLTGQQMQTIEDEILAV